MKYSAYQNPADPRKLVFHTEAEGSKHEHRYASIVLTEEADGQLNPIGRMTLTRAQVVSLVGEMVTWLGRP